MYIPSLWQCIPLQYLQDHRNGVRGRRVCPSPPKKFSVTLRCPFSNCTYSSFPNFILFRLANYWLVLIYDFTVSGLLKIKLMSSICFHRIRPKILVFQSLTSHLTPFSLVWVHEIYHSKQNVFSCLLHRNDLSCHRWRENRFIKE